MGLNLNGVHDDAIQVTALRGEYGGVGKLDMVVQPDGVFSCG
jgi:hypothetical protein